MRIVLFILLAIAFVGIGAVFVMLGWSWVIPDVFAGAVEQHVLPAAISFGQALKLMVLLSILGLTGRAGSK